MPLTACTIQEVLSTDNPNEGRVKINNNFECIKNTINDIEIESMSNWSGGNNYILVKAQSGDTENAQELQSAYYEAVLMSPSSSNTITIIASPGYYNFGTSAFTMDTDYINLTSLDGNRSIIFNAVLNDLSFSSRTEGSIIITANNVFVKGVDVLDKNFTIEDDLSGIKVHNCKGGDFSFGGVDVGDSPLIVSGEFIDCEGNYLSFGGNGEAVGVFKNCIAGDESYGYFSSSGTFTNCQGGDLSFSAFGILDGNYENCKGGVAAFGAGAALILDSNVKNCVGDSFSFGFSALIGDCVFENCIGGSFSFGSSYDTINEGKYYNCRLTDGVFDTPTLDGFIILGIDGNNNVQNITGV